MRLEAELWGAVNAAGPFIWYLKSISALLCFLMTLFLPAPPFRAILGARYFAMGGMLAIGLSMLFNTALGPIGDVLFWPSFVVWLGATVWSAWPRIIAEIRHGEPSPERILFAYVLGIVTGTPARIYKTTNKRE